MEEVERLLIHFLSSWILVKTCLYYQVIVYIFRQREVKSKIPKWNEARLILWSLVCTTNKSMHRTQVTFVPFRDCSIPKRSRQNHVSVVITRWT